MKMFSELFLEQDSFEIEYGGKMIYSFYTFDKIGTYILRFTFVNTCSCYGQAIIAHLDTFKGQIYIDKKEIKLPKGSFPQLVFPKNRCPRQFELKVVLEAGDITICNGSDSLGTEEIWHSMSRGCAMIIERLEENHFRFYCNDHENDDDFNDLIFDMEIVTV